jgi:hypothetical protein
MLTVEHDTAIEVSSIEHGWADPLGEVLCQQTVSPVCPSCSSSMGYHRTIRDLARRRALCLHAG